MIKNQVNLQTGECKYSTRGLELTINLQTGTVAKDANHLFRFFQHIYQAGQADLIDKFVNDYKTDHEHNQAILEKQKAMR